MIQDKVAQTTMGTTSSSACYIFKATQKGTNNLDFIRRKMSDVNFLCSALTECCVPIWD